MSASGILSRSRKHQNYCHVHDRPCLGCAADKLVTNRDCRVAETTAAPAKYDSSRSPRHHRRVHAPVDNEQWLRRCRPSALHRGEERRFTPGRQACAGGTAEVPRPEPAGHALASQTAEADDEAGRDASCFTSPTRESTQREPWVPLLSCDSMSRRPGHYSHDKSAWPAYTKRKPWRVHIDSFSEVDQRLPSTNRKRLEQFQVARPNKRRNCNSGSRQCASSADVR